MMKHDLFDHVNVIEANESMVAPETKRGFLKKYSRKGFFRNWKNRYFILESGYLYYYESSKDYEPYGVNLKGQMSLINSTLGSEKSQKKSGRINILGGSGERDILLEVASSQSVEWNIWMQRIKEHSEYATVMYNKYSAIGMPRNVSFQRFMSICSEVEERQSILAFHNGGDSSGYQILNKNIASTIPSHRDQPIENQAVVTKDRNSIHDDFKLEQSSQNNTPLEINSSLLAESNHIEDEKLPESPLEESIILSESIEIQEINSQISNRHHSMKANEKFQFIPKQVSGSKDTISEKRQSKLIQLILNNPEDYELSHDYQVLSHPEKVEILRLKDDMDKKVNLEREKRERLIAFVSTDGYEKSSEYENLTLKERLQLSLLREEEERKNKFLSQKKLKLNAFLDCSDDGKLGVVPLTPVDQSHDNFKSLSLSQRLSFLRNQEQIEKQTKRESDKKLKLNAFLSIPNSPDNIEDSELSFGKGSVTDRFEKAKMMQQLNTEERLISLKLLTSPTTNKNST